MKTLLIKIEQFCRWLAGMTAAEKQEASPQIDEFSQSILDELESIIDRLESMGRGEE